MKIQTELLGVAVKGKQRKPDKNGDNIDVTLRKSKGTAVLKKVVSNHTAFNMGVNLRKILE
jgi:hypothetical protein